MEAVDNALDERIELDKADDCERGKQEQIGEPLNGRSPEAGPLAVVEAAGRCVASTDIG